MTTISLTERYQTLLESIKSERDQVVVQLDLETIEMQNEWREIEKKLDRLCGVGDRIARAQAGTTEEIWKATNSLGQEVKDGYQRIKRAVGE